MTNQSIVRTPAGSGINSGRFASHGHAEDANVTLDAAASADSPPVIRPLRWVLSGMHHGSSTTVELPDGAGCQISYREYPAIGDSGQPVCGDVTGEYSVQVNGTYVSSVAVSAHGAGGYGNPRAKRYAAEEVERSIAALSCRHSAKTARIA